MQEKAKKHILSSFAKNCKYIWMFFRESVEKMFPKLIYYNWFT